MKYHQKQASTIIQLNKIKPELDEIQSKFNELQKVYDELRNLRAGQNRVVDALKNQLINEWNFTEGEIASALK